MHKPNKSPSFKSICFLAILVTWQFIALNTPVWALEPTPEPAENGSAGEGLYVGTVGAAGFAISFGSIITTLLSAVLAIGALAAFAYLIWGSVEWIISGGEKGKIEEGRNKIVSAVIGLLVLSFCYGVFKVVINILGFDTLTDALGNIRQLRVE